MSNLVLSDTYITYWQTAKYPSHIKKIFFHFEANGSLDDFRAVLFHSPYSRLCQKAFAWLSFVDYQRDVTPAGFYNDLQEYKNMTLAEILQLENGKTRSDSKDRFTDKAINACSFIAFEKLDRHLEFGQRIGNMFVFWRSRFKKNLDFWP